MNELKLSDKKENLKKKKICTLSYVINCVNIVQKSYLTNENSQPSSVRDIRLLLDLFFEHMPMMMSAWDRGWSALTWTMLMKENYAAHHGLQVSLSRFTFPFLFPFFGIPCKMCIPFSNFLAISVYGNLLPTLTASMILQFSRSISLWKWNLITVIC